MPISSVAYLLLCRRGLPLASSQNFQLAVRRTMADYSPLPQEQPPPSPEQLPAVELVAGVDWKYVERLLPHTQVPLPRSKPDYPSGWTQQTFAAEQKSKYWLKRTVNHMFPVYLQIRDSGSRRITTVRKVRGDIFLMHNELKRFLEEATGLEVVSQVDEACMVFRFKGDHVELIKQWLRQKGL